MENDGSAARISGVEMDLVEEQNDVVAESDSSPRTDPDLSAHTDPDSAGDGVAGEDGWDSFRLVRVEEGSKHDKIVKTTFVKRMSSIGLQSAPETVYKPVLRGVTWKTRLLSFQELAGIQRIAWFGGSKEEISNVLRYGFASRGPGITLSPLRNPTLSLRDCVADEDGLYHMIFCRAKLGNPELLRPGAAQRFATSEDSYAGVDNLACPTFYVVWSSFMNTHVMPMFVVSFKPPVYRVRANEGAAAIRRDPFIMATAKLIDELALVLPARAITRLRKLNGDLEQRNITKAVMTQELRQLAGDDVLRMATDSVIRARAPVAVNPVGAVRANEGAAPRWKPFLVSGTELVQEISTVLPASTITIQKVHRDCLEKKITKEVMEQKLKQIAGADVFAGAIASLKRKRGTDNNDASKVVKKLRREGSP